MMRLAHPTLHTALPLRSGRPVVLAVEHRTVFRQLVAQLLAQCQGEAGDFVLSKDWEPLPIARRLALVTDMFSLPVNERKQVSSLQKEAGALASGEKLFELTCQMKAVLSDWLSQLEQALPYPISYEDELPPEALLKLVSFRFDEASDSMVEDLERYAKIGVRFLGMKVFVFVNLYRLLDDMEVSQLCKTITYLDAAALLLESDQPPCMMSSGLLYIVDKDLCELYPETDNP